MEDLRKLTILHSNDMHGDFMAEKIDEKLIGGVSRLSGYVSKTRAENKNVIYAIAGDMFRGSIIDSEFQGVSTVDIMNMLAPDVVCLGNHELDYGIAHLLFLEKCAKFHIINANLYIKTTHTHLFDSHIILKVGGMNILFIGLLTEEIMNAAKKDILLSTLVNIEDAAKETGRIINCYKRQDIDLTVLLTHIGFEEDKKLAALLEPEWGVDVIIGGHSHTWLTAPEKINNTLIVQAGTGTDCIGRFDITVDVETNSVHDYKWELIPIDDSTCPRDEPMETLIASYKQQTDMKYGQIITRFSRTLTHPQRDKESELGNLFADALKTMLGTDIVMLGSGSIRKEKLGPVVTLQDLMEIYPFMDKVYDARLTGAQLKHAVCFIHRDVMPEEHTEYYQLSGNVRICYDYESKKLQKFTIDGREVEDTAVYSVAMQAFHYNNITAFLDIKESEIAGYDRPRCISTSDFDDVEEYLRSHPHLSSRVEGRIETAGQAS